MFEPNRLFPMNTYAETNNAEREAEGNRGRRRPFSVILGRVPWIEPVERADEMHLDTTAYCYLVD